MRAGEHTRPPEKALTVQLPDGRSLRFDAPFYIGRDRDCEVRIDEQRISRRHAEASRQHGRWLIRDLQSSNGLFVDGQRVETALIGDGLVVSLGSDGPTLTFTPETSARVTTPEIASRHPEDGTLEGYAERYFGAGGDDKVGSRTLMIRRAFQQVQQRQKRRHRWVVSAVAIIAVFAAGYAYYGYRQLSRQQAIAQDLFYSMKSLDMDIARVEQQQAGSPQGRTEVAKYMEQRRQIEANYDRFVANLYDRRLNEKERLILKVTRNFGECELAAPPEYIREVTRYIQRWQATGRYSRAVKLSQDLGYPRKIAAEFIAQDLPPQFFYLALQESDFDAFRSGPKTRMGIAKGMWQFIPETGQRYGLKIGPQAAFPRPDPEDDRHNWQKATGAAARYMKDIYATDAQASGLLVMASYNWGENRVINLLRTMPANPRERNFWKLLERYRERLPVETYDYVFYIVSAAVIGENPRLFGFQFDSPLTFLEQQS
jgi:membrane-bound lytic murein transglycosylase D